MKRITTILLLLPAFAFAQVKLEKEPSEKSKLETFSLKTGNLIKKEFIDVGEVKKVEIKALKITDLISKTNVNGIKMETIVSKSFGTSTKSCFLDEDEIDGFVKSGRLLLNMLSETTDNYTEYQFTSRDGFQAGAFYSKKEWKYFVKLERFDSDSYVFLDKESFQKMIEIVDKAQKML